MVKRVAHERLHEAEIDALLARPTSAVMAFVDGKGYPRMVPCWFVWHDGAFYTTSQTDKFHVRAIRRNPRGSFCVEIEDVTAKMRSNRQVKGVGEFEILETDAESIGRRIRRKYLGDLRSDAPAFADRIVVRLRPERLTAHGGDLIVA